MEKNNQKKIGSLLVFITLALGAGGLYQFIQQAIAEGVYMVTQTRTLTMYIWGAGLVGLLLLLVTLWTKLGDRYFDWLNALKTFVSKLGWFNGVILVGLEIALLFLVSGYYGRYFAYPIPRFFLVWVVALVGWLFFAASWDWEHWATPLLMSLLLTSFFYYIAGYAHDISVYPLSLGWSEGSRFYYASTFFGEQLYGQSIPLPITHPSRYVMQAVPFLIAGLPLWGHRAWQVALSLGLTVGGSWLLVRRLKLVGWQKITLFTLWGTLFLLQAPVFYQMMLIVILMAWLVDVDRFWYTMLMVVIASLWAGITRINWVPMPALLAAVFFYLERPLQKKGFAGWWQYLWPSLAWFGGGMVAGLLSQYGYALISRNALDTFSSSFTSDLLWDRLWPNPAYPLGILTGILWVSAPMLIYVIWGATRKGWHGLRLLGLFSIIGIFFAGGVVVSVKIGGGTNLHNMDAYLVFLMILALYLVAGRVAGPEGYVSAPLPKWGVLVLALVPIWFAIMAGRGPVAVYDFEIAERIIGELQEAVDDANAQDKEILFISQRQLIVFGYLENVELVPEYEKLILMEMAMARNDPYLSTLEDDLREQRFAYIVTDPLFVKLKENSGDALHEENDIWVKLVTQPILCAYEKAFTQNGVQILKPLDTWACE